MRFSISFNSALVLLSRSSSTIDGICCRGNLKTFVARAWISFAFSSLLDELEDDSSVNLGILAGDDVGEGPRLYTLEPPRDPAREVRFDDYRDFFPDVIFGMAVVFLLFELDFLAITLPRRTTRTSSREFTFNRSLFVPVFLILAILMVLFFELILEEPLGCPAFYDILAQSLRF